MNMLVKTFPNIKIIIILLTFLIFCCDSENKSPLDEKEFVEVYAGLTIIDELKISAFQKDSLTTDLLKEKQVSREQIKLTLEYFKQNPEQWVDILQSTRDYIKELKKTEIPNL